MDNLLFLDTETTGTNTDARLVQLGYSVSNSDAIVEAIFNPTIPIEVGAMATHYITNKMVQECSKFQGSTHHILLETLLLHRILVAHNAPFDIMILKNEGLETVRYIDTLQVAKHLIDADKYSLQYLRFLLGFELDVTPHSAGGDIIVLKELFNHLKKLIQEKYSIAKYTIEQDDLIIEKMIELTNTPVLLKKIQFGKYKGYTFDEIKAIDKMATVNSYGKKFLYLDWLLEQELKKDKNEQNKDLIFTLEHFIKLP